MIINRNICYNLNLLNLNFKNSQEFDISNKISIIITNI